MKYIKQCVRIHCFSLLNIQILDVLVVVVWVDLPQVDCERASENEGRSRATRAKVARRVDLFRLRNIEFNLHIVGA